MQPKKNLKEYFLLLTEGPTESNIFAFLTKVKYKNLFLNSTIQFSQKVEIAELEISNGRLNGVNSLKTFKQKYNSIKKKYKGQKRFFILDNDLTDSDKIEKLIKENNDLVQFNEFNSEFLLLKIAGKNPKKPTDFKNLTDFRSYCKSEFLKQFKKNASEFKDKDFGKIFKDSKNADIEKCFSVLLKLIT